MPSSRSCHHTRRLVCCLSLAIRGPEPQIIRANWEAVAVNANPANRVSSTITTGSPTFE